MEPRNRATVDRDTDRKNRLVPVSRPVYRRNDSINNKGYTVRWNMLYKYGSILLFYYIQLAYITHMHTVSVQRRKKSVHTGSKWRPVTFNSHANVQDTSRIFINATWCISYGCPLDQKNPRKSRFTPDWDLISGSYLPSNKLKKKKGKEKRIGLGTKEEHEESVENEVVRWFVLGENT